MKQEKNKKYANIIIELVITIVLSIWFLIPMFKEIINVSLFTKKYEYVFMGFVGTIGIYALVFSLYKKIIKSENKKIYLKEILPILVFFIYLIWTFVSCIFSPNKELAFYGTEYRKDGYITYLIYAGFFSLAYLLSSNRFKKILLNLFLVVAVSTLVLIELANHKILFQTFWMKDITIGIFDNSNHYGYYLLLATMISTMLFITEKNKIIKVIYLMVYSFLLYYSIINDTFGCYLAMLTTLVMLLIYYCIYKRDKVYLSTIPIAIFIIVSCFAQVDGKNIVFRNIKSLSKDLFNITYSVETNDKDKKLDAEKAGSGRIRLWINGTKFFMERPLLGYGPENLKEKYNEVGINQDRAHNLIIQLATTSGLPGLILYALAVGIILKRTIFEIKNNKENDLQLITLFAIIAYLISAMFGNSMYYTSPYFFIILGFLTHEIIVSKEKNIDKTNDDIECINS